MKREFLVPLLLIVGVSMLVTPIAVSYAAPPTIPIRNRLDYFSINLLAPWPLPDPLPNIEIPADETTCILHGWVTGPDPLGEGPELPFWREMTGQQKNEYFKTALFELEIDDVSVDLRRFQWYDHASDGMYVVYYAIFPENYFTLGTPYEFEGYWSVEFNGILYDYTVTRTIIPS